MIHPAKSVMFIFLTAVFFLFQPGWLAVINNPDNPARGRWDFKLKKQWELHSAGKDIFARIRCIRVSNKKKIYVHDIKNKKFFIFSPDGQFLKAFGKAGEGPGDIKMVEAAQFFLVNDKIIVADVDRIHYFTAAGEFIRSVRSDYFGFHNYPTEFISETSYLSVPLQPRQRRGAEGIKLYDIESQQEKVIVKFSAFKGSVFRQRRDTLTSLHVFGVTPVMVCEYHNNRLYYGMNDTYRIHISDLEGNIISSFQLERQARKVTPAFRREIIEKSTGDSPPEVIKKLVNNLPDTTTYFDRIEVHGGLIYIFESEIEAQRTRQIDIFSMEGKYLYRAFISVEEGFTIVSPPVFTGETLYVALEDGEGKIIIRKYAITPPAPNEDKKHNYKR